MINKNICTHHFSQSQILDILADDCLENEADLFLKARQIRQESTGNKIFAYGFIYLSTYCRNACTFCLYSHKNKELERYRKSLDEILEIAKTLADEGVHLLDLTLGEDPYYIEGSGFDYFLEIIHKVKSETKLPIMVSPGVLKDECFPLLKEAGADWYALYQENHSREEFMRLREGQDFDLRQNARLAAAKAGLLVEDGLLTGAGENVQSLAYSILSFQNSILHQSRIMTYVGHESTIPEHKLAINTELRAISLLRLTNPQHLIPASLDIDGINGLKSRLNAGANLITSIVPAGFGLNGVASAKKDIENEQRSIKAVKRHLDELGLELASVEDYKNWIKSQNRTKLPEVEALCG